MNETQIRQACICKILLMLVQRKRPARMFTGTFWYVFGMKQAGMDGTETTTQSTGSTAEVSWYFTNRYDLVFHWMNTFL